MIGNSVAAAPLTAIVSAIARPREVSNREVTALVQIVVWVQVAASEMPNHRISQLTYEPLAVPSKANAVAIMTAPSRPIRRGPNRSIKKPTSRPITAAPLFETVMPDEISARLQPNSALSGAMKAPSE